jgi:NADPH-dependent curcumin reductase CurA
MVQNRGVIYKKHPEGFPQVGVHLVVETREFDLNQAPPPGGVITRNLYASLDPYMRGRMRDPLTTTSYSAAFELDKPITAYSLGQVIASDNEQFQKGDIIWTGLSVEEYSAVPKEELTPRTQKLENEAGLPLSNYLGILGMTGLTAYSSLYEIGAPKKGETIFISSAAGAVGQIVGQIAKIEGLHVIGSVGDDKKLAFITDELGFDAGFNYKKEKPADALKRLAPNGVDIYYENVGGEHLAAALDAMNLHGRIGTFTPSPLSLIPELSSSLIKRESS